MLIWTARNAGLYSIFSFKSKQLNLASLRGLYCYMYMRKLSSLVLVATSVEIVNMNCEKAKTWDNAALKLYKFTTQNSKIRPLAMCLPALTYRESFCDTCILQLDTWVIWNSWRHEQSKEKDDTKYHATLTLHTSYRWYHGRLTNQGHIRQPWETVCILVDCASSNMAWDS
jgi:hypothetical protein